MLLTKVINIKLNILCIAYIHQPMYNIHPPYTPTHVHYTSIILIYSCTLYIYHTCPLMFNIHLSYGPQRDKTCLQGFREGEVQTRETIWKIDISLEASLGTILSNKRITKALIRLCGCAGWSVPLLFTNP